MKLEDLEYLSGRESIKVFQSSPTVQRKFCENCGSTLEWFTTQKDSHTAIALGTLDSPYEKQVTKNIYTDTKAPWL